MTIPRNATSVITAALVVVAIAGCSHSSERDEDTRAQGSSESEVRVERGELTVVDGELRRTTWALQNQIFGLSVQPSVEKMPGLVHQPFAGTLAPVAAPSPVDERLLAYNSFANKRPVLRVRNVVKNEDRILDVGTYSFAWRRDGAIASFEAENPRVPDPMRYRGHVVVRASPDAEPVRWTRKRGRYVVSAWAGDRLLVHVQEGVVWPRLVALERSGRMRVLAGRAALVALSPDGSRAFVTREPTVRPIVSVVNIETGRELASLPLDVNDPIGEDRISYVSDSGSWVGDTVIAAVTRGVAIFRVLGDDIQVEQVLAVQPDVFPLGLSEPKFAETDRYFVAGAEIQQRPRAAFSRTALMECDRVERHCVLGRAGPSFQPPRPIYDPSRP